MFNKNKILILRAFARQSLQVGRAAQRAALPLRETKNIPLISNAEKARQIEEIHIMSGKSVMIQHICAETTKPSPLPPLLPCLPSPVNFLSEPDCIRVRFVQPKLANPWE
ncbi:hypothetical protein [Nostoc sp. FACHB-110]|uniref:hypothetical protein n=1 Tax=Nostoc sp. FACHB-110 TaxID=2692834 RepID=UPI0016849406|nr:hypothetical protein [Nostoc sp. FACHB-110]MBD2439010.1 hypothetical protein [Nostoc sp. FACHB-110]